MNDERQVGTTEILKPAAEREFITQYEAMAEFPTSRQTLWRMRKGGLATYRLGSKVVLRRSDLLEFMRRGVAA